MDKWERMERTFDRVEARVEARINRKRGYSRIASQEELNWLEDEDNRVTLKTLTKAGEILVDENTKTPYIVFNKVRFDIEPIVEQEIG